MISLKNVDKYFFKGRQNEIHVIDDISLELPDKGIVALFGHSGCGKTTLLNTIGGLDNIGSGSIEIDGQNIKKNTDELRNRYIGYIFQNYNLNLKVSNYENVAESLRLLGMEDEAEIEKRVYAALKNVGMDKFAQRMPDTLSGGQKQRIAIARAIVKNPAIVLADEPTGNLDEANTIAIMNLLKSISKEHLVLLVTHEANLVDYYCDRVIGLKDGHITEIRDNSDANGYVAKDKNVVYLGDYEKSETTLGHVKLTRYGDDMPEDISVKIVNRNGSILLLCNSPKVKVLDDSSEITFREGTYSDEERRAEQQSAVNMEELPPVEGKRFGTLFHWKNSLRESVEQLRAVQTKNNKTLKRVMQFFTIIIVMLIAVLCRNLKDYMDKMDTIDKNVFLVSGSIDNLKDIFSQEAETVGRIDGIASDMGRALEVDADLFESYSYYDGYGGSVVSASGATLNHKLAEGKRVVYGRGLDNIASDEVLISTFIAEKMVENSKIGCISEVSDLLGLSIQSQRIVGIVESDEPEVYFSNNYLYSSLLSHTLDSNCDSSYDVADGEVRLYVSPGNEYCDKKPGDSITIGDRTFKVCDVRDVPLDIEGDAYYELKLIFSENDMYSLFGESIPGYFENYETYITFQVHSQDIAATQAFLNRTVGTKSSVSIESPEKRSDEIAGEALDSLVNIGLVVLVFVLFLALSMYMVMRSSVMSRIKEIGVYRSIGVTKKNLYFKFMVEGLAMATLYILPTFLVFVGVIYWINNYSGIQMQIFLPWYIGIPTLLFMYGTAVVCSILPASGVLIKTPAQIMAKYDV